MNEQQPMAQTGQALKKGGWMKDILSVLIMACVLAAVLKLFIVDSRIVPTTSMYPTVHAGDRILMNKFIYYFTEPERGDIIVFKPTPEIGEDQDMLKRIIGLPGDTIEVRNNTLYVNGEARTEDYIADKPNYVYGPITVPEGCYFVMGDNRNSSYDSHLWPNPFLPAENIKGQVFLCYWPIDRMGLL